MKRKKKAKLAKQAQLEINVKTMSNKLSNRTQKQEADDRKKKMKAERLAREKAAKEKAEAEAKEAEIAAAAAAAEAAIIAAADAESEDEEPVFDPRENARATFRFLDVDRDGQLSEDEFVEGCLSDPMFMVMLETFKCDFLWGDGM